MRCSFFFFLFFFNVVFVSGGVILEDPRHSTRSYVSPQTNTVVSDLTVGGERDQDKNSLFLFPSLVNAELNPPNIQKAEENRLQAFLLNIWLVDKKKCEAGEGRCNSVEDS